MWVLIVVTAFYQRGPQPEVVMHDFQTEQACVTAANWTVQAVKAAMAETYDHNSSYSVKVQCKPKQ